MTEHKTKETVQDTIISVIIAFALAFVFRGFVVEAFVIPTGSMAPTLDGAHETIRSQNSGYTWDVGPWSMYSEDEPRPIQAPSREDKYGKAAPGPMIVHDPMTGETLERRDVPLMSGDR